mmetsp:Transcript_24228/g.53791  ORF Transcript_24228/g.53791 Transcript_24228/m.53791 type:complete len:202 (-) Transcript_24228:547-1152(-)
MPLSSTKARMSPSVGKPPSFTSCLILALRRALGFRPTKTPSFRMARITPALCERSAASASSSMPLSLMKASRSTRSCVSTAGLAGLGSSVICLSLAMRTALGFRPRIGPPSRMAMTTSSGCARRASAAVSSTPLCSMKTSRSRAKLRGGGPAGGRSPFALRMRVMTMELGLRPLMGLCSSTYRTTSSLSVSRASSATSSRL